MAEPMIAGGDNRSIDDILNEIAMARLRGRLMPQARGAEARSANTAIGDWLAQATGAPGLGALASRGERGLRAFDETGRAIQGEMTGVPGLLRAGEAVGQAAADPTLANLTDAGVKTGAALFKPGMILTSVGTGYGTALAQDTGLLGGAANAQSAKESRAKRDAEKAAADRAKAEAEAAAIKARSEVEMQRARTEAEAKAAAERKAEADAALQRGEYDRSIKRAEAARDFELGRSRRFSDTETGKLWEKTGGLAPLIAGAVGGGISRAATGGGSNLYNYKLPAAIGGVSGVTAPNVPLAYNAFYTEPDNPERRAYEAYARELPANHPRRKEWQEYARTLPEANPVRTAAADELYNPLKAAERMAFGGVEGVAGGLLGADIMRLPGRAVEVAASLPGRAKAGYNRGMIDAEGARGDLARARLTANEADAYALQSDKLLQAGRRQIDEAATLAPPAASPAAAVSPPAAAPAVAANQAPRGLMPPAAPPRPAVAPSPPPAAASPPGLLSVAIASPQTSSGVPWRDAAQAALRDHSKLGGGLGPSELSAERFMSMIRQRLPEGKMPSLQEVNELLAAARQGGAAPRGLLPR